MTTIYVRHDVTTVAEVNALALDEDQRENGAIVLYDGITCYWSINRGTRNEIPGRWYDNSRDGLQLVDGDEVAVLVPIEAVAADLWDEGYEAGMLDTYRLGRDMDLTITPAPNPYRASETA